MVSIYLQQCFGIICFIFTVRKMLLFRSVYIIRFLSGLMLMVFALSITPKRFLHNAFAKHVDSKPAKNNNKPYQLSNSGYNCDTDNLVAESSFLNDLPSFQLPLSTTFSSYIVKSISFTSISAIYSPLRGPPQNI